MDSGRLTPDVRTLARRVRRLQARVTPAICWAQPDDPELPGYMTEIEEDQARGRSMQSATDEAGEALITIIADKMYATAVVLGVLL